MPVAQGFGADDAHRERGDLRGDARDGGRAEGRGAAVAAGLAFLRLGARLGLRVVRRGSCLRLALAGVEQGQRLVVLGPPRVDGELLGELSGVTGLDDLGDRPARIAAGSLGGLAVLAAVDLPVVVVAPDGVRGVLQHNDTGCLERGVEGRLTASGLLVLALEGDPADDVAGGDRVVAVVVRGLDDLGGDALDRFLAAGLRDLDRSTHVEPAGVDELVHRGGDLQERDAPRHGGLGQAESVGEVGLLPALGLDHGVEGASFLERVEGPALQVLDEHEE